MQIKTQKGLSLMEKSTLLYLHAQTSLHTGSGEAMGNIDLPVQRERHTAWPLIPGSSIKGVLRDYCRNKLLEKNPDKDAVWADRDPEIEAVFGPSVKGTDGNGRGSNAADFAGALAITDASILFFPVRSLNGLFAYVTCPGALLRYQQFQTIAGGAPLDASLLVNGAKETDAKIAANPLVVSNPQNGSNDMVLEEFNFKTTQSTALGTFAKNLADELNIPRLAYHIALIHDNWFTHFVKNATEITARIALDYETKTVSGTALFYVETLPAETVFYSLLVADAPKSKKPLPQGVLGYVRHTLAPNNPKASTIIQLGGEASTGKGLCRTILSPEQEEMPNV